MGDGRRRPVLEIVRILEKKHYTNTKAMTKVWVRCLRCDAVSLMLQQNATKHNRLRRTHCAHCIKDRYHNLTNTRIWRIWRGMRTRCNGSSNDRDRRNYSGRGVVVCERWQQFENFYEDMREGYSDDLTIERIDGSGDYCKENCRWASNMEQQANNRNNRALVYQGERVHLAELCRRTGLSRGKLTAYLAQDPDADAAVKAAQASRYNQGKPRKSRSTT
jgi:hypothetical protein